MKIMDFVNMRLAFVIALFFASSFLYADSCEWKLEMIDGYHNGWEGGYVEVFINGESRGTSKCLSSYSTEVIPVQDGDALTLRYTAGKHEEDNRYTLYDHEGIHLFSDGPRPLTGEAFHTSVSCRKTECGNGIAESVEECDGNDLRGKSCESLGFDSGDLTCDGGCRLDSSACIRCGNGIKEGDEECDDGNDINTDECIGCRSAYCGDGFINGGVEKCELGQEIDCSEIDPDFSGTAPCSDCRGWDLEKCEKSYKSNLVIGLNHFSHGAGEDTIPPKGKIERDDLVDVTKPRKAGKNETDGSEGNQTLPDEKKGWFFELPEETLLIGSPVYCKDRLYFVTYTKPSYYKDEAADKNICKPKNSIGWSYLWEVNAWSGRPLFKNSDFKDDRIWSYLGQGIASQPVVENNCERIIVGIPGDPGDPHGNGDSDSETKLKPALGSSDSTDEKSEHLEIKVRRELSIRLNILWWKVD